MSVIKSIRKLRILAFFLFLTPAIGLVGSLIIHNYLISFKFEKGYNYNFKLDKSEKSSTILCSKNNEFCKNRNIDYQKITKLDQCYKNKISELVEINNKIHAIIKKLPPRGVISARLLVPPKNKSIYMLPENKKVPRVNKTALKFKRLWG